MTDAKGARGAGQGPRREAEPESWRSRVPLSRLPGPKGSRLPADRHAAITGSLHSYANYKSWADKIRTSWEPPAPEKKD